ncbi:MAG TPA: hypothetical protein VK809_01205, partial [Bacteroidia bacterium]|nr:hypothetical protein [Bacteroidia bacterium]
MLLKIFKTNPLLLLIFGIAFSVLLWGSTVFHTTETARTYTDITLLAPFFDRIHDMVLLKAAMGFAILLIEAATWNSIVNKHSLLRQSTY